MTTSADFATISAILDNPTSTLTGEEKRSLYATLGQHLLKDDEQEVVTTTKALVAAYAALGVTDVAAVEFGTSEWDNGYFFSAESAILIDVRENIIDLDDLATHPDSDLFDHIDTALTECVDTSLGYRSRATVNIADGTFSLTV